MVDRQLVMRRMVSDVVYAYRMLQGEGGEPASLRAFCEMLNEVLARYEMHIVHQTVKNWEDRSSVPRMYILGALRRHATDWRRDLALDLLAAVLPDDFEPVTVIGQRAKARSRVDTGPLKRRYGEWWV